MPNRAATRGAAVGTGVGMVQVATMTRPTALASMPALARAFPPAATAMSTTVSSGSANRRDLMPSRLMIQSLSVCTPRAIRSSLVTTFDGW